MRLAGKPPGPPWDKIAGVYRTGDGRYVRLHTNFPASSRRHAEAAAAAPTSARRCRPRSLKWEGETFETAAAEAKLVATMMRSPAEWAAHPQGQAVAQLPLLEITQDRRGPGPRRCRPTASGRCRASACSISRASSPGRCAAARSPRTAPTSCASRRRTCRVCPSSTSIPAAASSRPRSTCAPTRSASGSPALLREAHIFVQGYRPGGLAALGFSPEACAEITPGIVAVTLSAYGHAGPWAGAARLRLAGAERERHQPRRGRGRRRLPRPKELPAQALDHATGYLMAFGAMMALARKAQRGRLVARARLAGADRPLACRASAASRTASPAPIPRPPTSPTCSTRWTRRSAA